MSGDPICRTRWESENVTKVTIKINRNQDPDLYRILSQSESKSGTARQLMQLGLKAMTEVPGWSEDL